MLSLGITLAAALVLALACSRHDARSVTDLDGRAVDPSTGLGAPWSSSSCRPMPYFESLHSGAPARRVRAAGRAVLSGLSGGKVARRWPKGERSSKRRPSQCLVKEGFETHNRTGGAGQIGAKARPRSKAARNST